VRHVDLAHDRSPVALCDNGYRGCLFGLAAELAEQEFGRYGDLLVAEGGAEFACTAAEIVGLRHSTLETQVK
jgi:hypothetical protein